MDYYEVGTASKLNSKGHRLSVTVILDVAHEGGNLPTSAPVHTVPSTRNKSLGIYL